MDDTQKMKKVMTKDEIALLIDLIQSNPILTSKETNATTNKCKDDAWTSLAQAYNARSGSVPKSKEQLKLKWDNLKKAARKRAQQIRMNNLKVLYWSDATEEIAFVVPSGHELADDDLSDVDGNCFSGSSRSSDRSGGSWWDVSGGGAGAGAGGAGVAYERSVSESERAEHRLRDQARTHSLELDKPAAATATTGSTTTQPTLSGSGRRNRDFMPKILIIWLEDFEDHLNLPIEALTRYCGTGVPGGRASVLCVGGVRGGLARVRVRRAAGVLADGALLAPRLLPAALRRAASFLARRDRLNTDLYQPPHVRRRHLIQDIAQQFKKDMTEPELLESLFKAP